MLPIAQHIIIQPEKIKDRSATGLKLALEENPFIGTGIVTSISKDIKDCPVKEGDRVAYLKWQEKVIDGNCVLQAEHLKAVL